MTTTHDADLRAVLGEDFVASFRGEGTGPAPDTVALGSGPNDHDALRGGLDTLPPLRGLDRTTGG